MDVAFPLVASLFLSGLMVATLVWAGCDAARRGRSVVWIVALCFLTWPVGFLIWRGIRPPPPLR